MSDVQSNVKPLTLTTGRVIFAIAGVYVTQSLVSALSMQSLPALVRAAGGSLAAGGTATVLSRPAEDRTTLHGERALDWHHWTLRGGEDLHLQTRGLNFSDPGLLLEAASAGLGVALVSERLSQPAREQGQLLPLSACRVKGPQWSLLIHQESEGMPECRAFCHWLGQQFADGEPDREEGGLATL